MLFWFVRDAAAADNPFITREVLRFDAGPRESRLSPGAFALTPDDLYSQNKGFGWETPPRQAFVRDSLALSRDAMTIDGVSSPSLSFRADVAEGLWYVTVWLEVDPLEQSRPQLKLQNRTVPVQWQIFPPSAEPNLGLPKAYRVFRAAVEVGPEGLVLHLSNKTQQLRLLGLTLLKHNQDLTSSEQDYVARIRSNATLDIDEMLRAFADQTRALAAAHSDSSFYAHWDQQLQMLALAEKYSSMRGWEWADKETAMGMFDRLHQTVSLLDAYLAVPLTPTDPFADAARFLRGKLLYWLWKERGGEEVIANAKRDLTLLSGKYPENEILSMYLGHRIQSTGACECLPSGYNAPSWSSAQRETICRLRKIAHWWVKHQSETGEFGGKLGDDIELLRWWAPLCLGGDKTALHGWQTLADGVWQSEHVTAGYATKVADVEHAAEFVADTAPLMAVYSDDPKYIARLGQSAKLFETLWTADNTNSRRFFRSAWFSSTDLESSEPKARDVELNTRAARALRYLSWRKPDPRVTNLLHEWSLAWTHAAMRTDKGKPQGIVPASVRFSDESFNGDSDNWYEANMYWDYFDWQHSCGSMMLDQLLFTNLVTNDAALLRPLELTLQLLDTDLAIDLKPGSQAWVKTKLEGCRLFWQVVEQWRIHTGDGRFDELIMKYGSPYGRFYVSGEEHHLTEGLERLLDDVRYNVPMKTSEAYFTDRVYVSDWELLKAMLTGDGIGNNLSPYFQVTWEDTDEDFTALVLPTHQNQIALKLFSHSAQQSTATMRVWKLPPGRFRMQLVNSDEKLLERLVNIEQKGHRISITLPPRELLLLKLIPIDRE